jgi:hypothetical protein
MKPSEKFLNEFRGHLISMKSPSLLEKRSSVLHLFLKTSVRELMPPYLKE